MTNREIVLEILGEDCVAGMIASRLPLYNAILKALDDKDREIQELKTLLGTERDRFGAMEIELMKQIQRLVEAAKHAINEHNPQNPLCGSCEDAFVEALKPFQKPQNASKQEGSK